MRRAVLIVVAGLLALMPAFPALAQPMQKVVLALNWFPVGDHAAYWVALEKGYYREKGLKVELQNSKGSADSTAKVDTGRADIGLADAAVVIAAVARGAKVKVVGAVFDKTPLNIWVRKDSPIKSPRDLEGKILAAPPGDAQRQLFPAFARMIGIDPNKVKWLSIEPAAKIVTLAKGRADAVADYTTGLPFYDKAMGKGNAVMMPWADYGFDMYSMSIIASEKTRTEKPKLLRDFLEASYRGWRDVMENPKAATEIFKRRVPEIDASIIEPNMRMGLELMKTERYAKHGIGWIDKAKMCQSVELINTYMKVPRKVGCEEVFTTEFLPRIDLPKTMRP
ncbi:MAG: ABC transporter substrate-binding protein [Candidatus Methylomirabilia bacterium]